MKRVSKGLTVISTAVLVFASLFAIATYVMPAFAAHNPTDSLAPEWSPASANVEYTVSICNSNPGDPIDEVRIIKNPLYSTFDCDNLNATGWEHIFVPSWFEPDVGNTTTQMCWYYTLNPVNNIPTGTCKNFTFSATTPSTESCGLPWKFESRDQTTNTSGAWEARFDSTGVDNTTPIFTKTVVGPQVMNGGACPNGPGPGEECWVRDHVTNVTVSVTDPGDAQCDAGNAQVVPSQLSYCDVWVVVDGTVDDDYNVTVKDNEQSQSQNGGVIGDLDQAPNTITFQTTFLEDSKHELEFECFDKAGNMVNDSETFRVDSTAPNTSKHFEGPQKIINIEGNTVEWIDGVSTIVLDESDPDPTGFSCNIGVNQTFYRVTQVDDINCWMQNNPDYCVPQQCEQQVAEQIDTLFFDAFSQTNPLSNGWTGTYPEPGDNENLPFDIYTDNAVPSPGSGGYYMVTEDDAAAIRTVSTLGYTDITLTYYRRSSFTESGDRIVAEWRVGTSGSWTELERSVSSNWIFKTFSLSPAANNKTAIQVRFWMDDGEGDFAKWDDINVSGKKTTETCENNEFQEYTGPIGSIPESCHEIEYYSVDSLGNTQDIQTNCFFVDKTPPVLTKDNGNAIPDVDENEPINGEFHWLTSEMPITFTCEDQLPHPSGDEEVCFKVTYDEPAWPTDVTSDYCSQYGGTLNDGYCCVDVDSENEFAFNFMQGEDSVHSLEYYCKDAVEKKTETHTQYYKVDNTPPTIMKDMFGTYLGDCPVGTDLEHGDCYVIADESSGVTVSFVDGGEVCAVDQVLCEYQVWWQTSEENCYGENTYNGTHCMVQSGNFDETTDISFTEDSTHVLKLWCNDALQNSVYDEETFLVDKTPPVTTKEYGDPFFSEEGYHWTTSDATITLTSEDEKVGVENVSWRVTLLDIEDEDCYVTCQEEGNGEWNVEEGDTAEFDIPETSCHLIEFYASDKLNNVEETHRQCVFVDNEAPVTEKDVGDPRVVCDPEVESCDYYVSQDTPITFTCTDSDPHPVDHVTISWRSRFAEDCNDLEESEWTDWSSSEGDEETIYFEEDSCHQLEYFCTDILGNEEDVQTEIDIVDTQPPVIDTTIVGPQFGDCPEVGEGDECFIDLATTIHVEATDPEPHPVDNVMCDWSYDVYDENWTFVTSHGDEERIPPFDINFPEESHHVLEITCWDALDNYAYKTETFSVDHTPPVTTKSFDGPQFPEDNDQTGVSHWITSSTEVELSVEDAGQHKSGINKTYYRVTLLDSDEPCNYDVDGYPEYLEIQEVQQPTACDEAEGSGDFVEYTGTFNVPETSCHLIEYYSVDNVEKVEPVKKQCVFVDNEYPLPNKTVGVPSDKIYPETYNWSFYPDVNGRCWTGENAIDCWKVTTLTPVTLGCADQDPHPVDHSKVWFNVDFDASDITQQYCANVSGSFDSESGYCLVTEKDAPVTLYFGEESEHNLKYYCEDALGNKGPVDDEKFKVEGTKFTIDLNKKWNLISVPFVLQNDASSKIFDPVNDSVISVWGYDAQANTWHIYTPDGIANDDLDTLVPGDGYWVLTRSPTTLTIGGTLFSPGLTPPSKDVINGWNLLGYYGTEGQMNYTGPPKPGTGKEAQCELYSIGESTFDTVFASLYSYWEPYNPNQWVSFNKTDAMSPGAGYWAFITRDGIYAPTTVC